MTSIVLPWTISEMEPGEHLLMPPSSNWSDLLARPDHSYKGSGIVQIGLPSLYYSISKRLVGASDPGC